MTPDNQAMNLLHLTIILSLVAAERSVFSQTGHMKQFLPGLDPESQTNVVVAVCDIFGEGQPCPVNYTNVLSNRNLFTLEQQKCIREAFAKYRNVTTNSGPPGAVLDSLYETNIATKAMYRTGVVDTWVADFKYTNLEAREEVRFGAGLVAEFRNMSNDGYNVSFTPTGDGTMFSFSEIRHGLISGLLARFRDMRPQGLAWDYKLADFTNSRLGEYRQYTNGMVFGKYLVWNVVTGNLLIEAEFKQPYDWRRHYRPTRWP